MDFFGRFAKIALPLALLMLAAIFVPFKVFDSKGLKRVKRLKHELVELKEDNTRIRRENEDLRSKIRAFHSDLRYIEKVARDDLGMVAPDEIIFQFPDEKDSKN